MTALHPSWTLRALAPLASAVTLLAFGAHASAQADHLPALRGDPDGEPPVVKLQVDPREALTVLASARAARARVPGAPARLGGLGASLHSAGAVPEGDGCSGVAFTPDGSRILLAHWESQNVLVWDAASGAFVGAIPVSGSPMGIAVSSDGVHAVVPNALEDTASILDVVAGTEVAVIPVGDQPGTVAISPDGTTAAVGNTVDGSVSIIDIASAVELRRVGGLGFSATLSLNFENGSLGLRFTQFLFAGNDTLVHPDRFADRVRLVDVATGVVTSVVVPATPEGVAVSPAGTTAVAACGGADSVAVIDVPSATLVKTIAVGADVFGGAIAVDPSAGKAVVAVLNACRVVNLVTNAVSASINTATVDELYTTADGLYAFGVGFNGPLISYASNSLVKNLDAVVNIGRGAVSPAGPRAAGVGVSFGEDFLIFATNGAAGGIAHRQASGPAPEGDKARLIDLSPDGSTVAVSEILSDTVGIHDAATGALLHSVAVGDRPAEVEFTPDGGRVVVANLDSSHASIIDVATGLETQVPISTRASQVEIARDGSYAYVAVVVSDGVWRIDLDTETVAGPLLATGNMGSIGYLYSQTSGLELSHDGRTLAVCGSFSNQLTLIDTTTWSVVANVPIAGFPVRAIFDTDDAHVLVTARDTDRVHVVTNAGPASAVIASWVTGDQPFELALSYDGTRLYVENFGSESVRVIRTATGTALGTIPLPDAPGGMELSADDAELYVATGNWTVTFGPGPAFTRTSTGQLSVIQTADLSIHHQADTGMTPSDLDYSAVARRVVVPSTFIDGFYAVELPPRRGPRRF